MRAVGITLISLALTTAVIGNAYYQKKQFYPSVVYITKSNPSMAVIYVQAFILVILMGKLMRKVFFGQLRAAEFEHLMERSWYAVTETCLAFTVFRDDFSPKFVALFTLLLFLKSFHWLAEDRVDYMERSPNISWLFHIRVLSLLVMLGALDLHFVGHAYQSTVTKGASVQLVFGFEYAILLTIIINICIKYALHTIDLNSENPWDNKAVFLLYTELVMGFFKVILYIAFVAIMVRIYTLPLFAFRPMYYTMRGFKKAFNDVILSRRAIHNMNTLYPDATQEELTAADNVCIICREEMVTASKKLPCNHIFHTSCLRSWFQRQQTCPTCRLNILRTPATPQPHAPPAQQPAPAAAAPPPPAAAPGMPHIPAGQFQPFPGPIPFWQMFQHPVQLVQPGQRPAEPQQPPPPATPGGPAPSAVPGTSTASSSTSPTAGTSGQAPTPTPATSQIPGATTGTNIPFVCPPFPFMPFIPPPPMLPPNFTGLSTEELKRMEGTMRESLEARLQCLRNIQLLLDASVTMMQQYTMVVAATARMAQTAAQSSPPPPPPPPPPSSSSTNESTSAQPASTSTSTTVNTEPVVTESTSPVAESSHKNSNNDREGNSEGAAATVVEPAAPAVSTPLPSNATTTPINPTLTKEQEEIRRRRLQKFAQASQAAE